LSPDAVTQAKCLDGLFGIIQQSQSGEMRLKGLLYLKNTFGAKNYLTQEETSQLRG
jgi:hypothetical protein